MDGKIVPAIIGISTALDETADRFCEKEDKVDGVSCKQISASGALMILRMIDSAKSKKYNGKAEVRMIYTLPALYSATCIKRCLPTYFASHHLYKMANERKSDLRTATREI